MLGGSQQVLRIDSTMKFASGNTLNGSLWVNQSGDILKERQDAMDGLVTYRATKEAALAEFGSTPYDVVSQLSVPVKQRLERPYDSKLMRYRIQVDGRDPAQVFPVGPSQAVRSAGDHVADVTVYAVRPDHPGNPDAPADPPTDEDRRPNSMIQSDNPAIQKLAEESVPAEGDPWHVAVALEHFVNDYISLTNYSQAFITAADVAKNREGDCTEHSVLLAALARARGIPARVAIGLIYTQQANEPVYGYHMWNEVYVNDRWIPLDATLARGGAGAARLKLTDSNLDGADALSCFLPVAQVAGRLKIEVLEVQ
jgi:transglutaminase-like putative cysteine protease